MRKDIFQTYYELKLWKKSTAFFKMCHNFCKSESLIHVKTVMHLFLLKDTREKTWVCGSQTAIYILNCASGMNCFFLLGQSNTQNKTEFGWRKHSVLLRCAYTMALNNNKFYHRKLNICQYKSVTKIDWM